MDCNRSQSQSWQICITREREVGRTRREETRRYGAKFANKKRNRSESRNEMKEKAWARRTISSQRLCAGSKRRRGAKLDARLTSAPDDEEESKERKGEESNFDVEETWKASLGHQHNCFLTA